MNPSQGDSGGFRPVLAFDVDDTQFVRGFECGDLWRQMQYDPQEFEQHIHTTNVEMVLRMAEASKRTVTAETLDETWMMVRVAEADDD